MKFVLILMFAAQLCVFPAAVNAGEHRQQFVQEMQKVSIKKPSRTPGSIMLPVSLSGSITLDITLDFEDVTDLSLLTAGISASLVTPLDVAITSRLPAGAISIPEEFPVLVLVEPPDFGPFTLAFDGIVDITILTPNLPYYPGTRLRLFTAHDGGDFEDITRETSKGSYRVRGSGGQFSEFLIVLDARDPSEIIDTKIIALQSLLSGYSGVIDTTVFANLDALLDSTDLLWQKGNLVGAMTQLDDFIAALEAATPAEVPDSWDATGGSDNVEGILRSKAATLKFSLGEFSVASRHQ